MDDQKFGNRCEICKRRDYIPFQCKKCKKKLCDEHFWAQEHHCRLQYNPPRPKIVNKVEKKEYHCGVCKARLTTVNHFFCDKCQTLFCLKHRIPEEHRCHKKGPISSCQII